jgi:septal ring factor EnvC (AmiA/AmiB activator)
MFLSATLPHKLLSPTQQADQQAIATDQQTLATDRATRTSTLASDRAAIPAVRNSDNATISADLARQRDDRGNPSQEQADIDQTRADRSKLLVDVHAAVLTQISDNRTTNQQILTDLKTLSGARLKYLYDLAHHVQ